ncbi:pseudouridine-5'-phosphate glycosidase [Paraclostridium sordellii]
MEFLGTSKNVLKASRRDLPFIISKKLNGATTVAKKKRGEKKDC